MNDYNVGEIWEAVKGETVTRGRLKADELGLHLWVGDSGRTPENLESYGFTLSIIEKAAAVVVLPAEPGAYACEAWADILILNTRGHWRNQWGSRIATTALEAVCLTRLEPVSETAKKVLDAIDNIWSPGDVRIFGYGYAKAIADEFGVTK